MLDKPAATTQEVMPVESTNKLRRVFRHRDFRLLWSGAFLSFVGSWIQNIAQGYLVYQLTKSEYLLGLVSFFGMVPVTILGPIAGSLTDTLNKRMLLVVTQSIFALGAGFLAAATFFNFVQYWHIVAVALVLGAVSAIEMPTRQSIVGRVVPPEDLPVAIPINALTFNMARLVGPALGGILLSTMGAAACYLVNALSFFALIFAGLAIRADLTATSREPQPMMDLIFEGALYTFREVRLRTLFILECSVSVFGLFYITQIPAFLDKLLKIDTHRLWESYLAVGIGSVIALGFIMTWSDRPVKAMVLRVSMTMLSLSLIALGFARSVWLAYVLFALIGCASIAIFNTCNTLFQLLSPERLRGRVLSMHVWALSGIGPFGVWGFGFIAQKFGLPFALEFGGALLCIFAAYAWIYRKGLAGVR
jgi:MFS family permease